MSTDNILNEREKTHGDFPTQAITAQALKYIMAEMPNWEDMPSYMRESLDLIATKISRMGHGDWKHIDSPKDGSGYFELIVRELEK
jgi:hypothetical protein